MTEERDFCEPSILAFYVTSALTRGLQTFTYYGIVSMPLFSCECRSQFDWQKPSCQSEQSWNNKFAITKISWNNKRLKRLSTE